MASTPKDVEYGLGTSFLMVNSTQISDIDQTQSDTKETTQLEDEPFEDEDESASSKLNSDDSEPYKTRVRYKLKNTPSAWNRCQSYKKKTRN